MFPTKLCKYRWRCYQVYFNVNVDLATLRLIENYNLKWKRRSLYIEQIWPGLFYHSTHYIWNSNLLSCWIPRKELSQIARNKWQKNIKNCENLMQGNTRSYYERFHGKHATFLLDRMLSNLWLFLDRTPL